MSKPDLLELIKTLPASELFQALADAYEEDLRNHPGRISDRLKREVTIEGLRELSNHERQWT